MPNWEEIQREWETSKITLATLAEKHNVKLGTLKSRKSRDKWSRGASKKDATIQKDATKKTSSDDGVKKKSSSTGKKKEHKRRSGNPNPSNQFTKRNRTAVTHGLFANYINDEQREIINQMQSLTLADQIWAQIEIKFSAIIRMQKIMWVDDEHDHLREESAYSSGAEGNSVSYKVMYAYERYESYIRAQARAMAEYRNLVKQYIELTDEFDERRLKLEAMQTGINKSNAEIAKLERESNPDTSKEDKLKEYFTALGGAFRDN